MKKVALVGCASIVATAMIGLSGQANAASLTEHCVAYGGKVVTKLNPPAGVKYVCEGGEFDGHVLGVEYK